MGQPVLPLAVGIVDQAYIIDGICRGIFGTHWCFECVGVGKRFEFFFYFLDDVVSAGCDIDGGEVAYKLVVSICCFVGE